MHRLVADGGSAPPRGRAIRQGGPASTAANGGETLLRTPPARGSGRPGLRRPGAMPATLSLSLSLCLLCLPLSLSSLSLSLSLALSPSLCLSLSVSLSLFSSL